MHVEPYANLNCIHIQGIVVRLYLGQKTKRENRSQQYQKEKVILPRETLLGKKEKKRQKRISQILTDKSKPALPLPTTYMEELEQLWGKNWGAQSEIGKLEEVMVHKESGQLGSIPEEDLIWHAASGPVDGKLAIRQHERLIEVLKQEGVKVDFLDQAEGNPRGPYSGLHRLWGTRDPGLVINGGAIVGRMALPMRRGEEVIWSKSVMKSGCPILYTVQGSGMFEGGNVVWLDQTHVCIGESIRTNMEGIEQVSWILKMAGVEEIRVVSLAGYLTECRYPSGGWTHLDSVFMYIDDGIGLIVASAVPFSFLNYLQDKDINLIEVPMEEYPACNVLTLEAGKIVSVAGYPETAKKLMKAGVDVIDVELSEIASGGHRQGAERGKGGTWGGPHCATAPLVRRPGPRLE